MSKLLNGLMGEIKGFGFGFGIVKIRLVLRDVLESFWSVGSKLVNVI